MDWKEMTQKHQNFYLQPEIHKGNPGHPVVS